MYGIAKSVILCFHANSRITSAMGHRYCWSWCYLMLLGKIDTINNSKPVTGMTWVRSSEPPRFVQNYVSHHDYFILPYRTQCQYHVVNNGQLMAPLIYIQMPNDIFATFEPMVLLFHCPPTTVISDVWNNHSPWPPPTSFVGGTLIFNVYMLSEWLIHFPFIS